MKAFLVAATVAVLTLLLPKPRDARAEASTTRFSAIDDSYDCTFTRDGTLVVGSHGGLLIGEHLFTALDGLPDTRVERVRVEGDSVVVQTRVGSARISLSTRRVSDIVTSSASGVPHGPPEFFRGGIVRRRGGADGQTCIATTIGVFRGRDGGDFTKVQHATPAIPSGDVSALAPSEDGLFVGTFDRGLFRVHRARIDAITHPAINPNINALQWDAARNTLWVATARGLTRCDMFDTVQCARVGGTAGVHALVLMKSGAVVVGGDAGLAFLSAAGSIESTATKKNGAPFQSVWALATAADGTLFVGTARGVYWGPERAFRTFTAADIHRASMVTGDLADDWVTALTLHGDELVVGTYNSGIASFARSRDGLRRTAVDPSLGYVNLGGISVLASGELAVGTMNGLRIGNLGSFRTAPTLGTDATAVAIQGDERWAASRRGISRF